MLHFNTIRDGNCLYNAFAVLLIRGFQLNQIDALLNDQAALNALWALLKYIDNKKQPSIDLSAHLQGHATNVKVKAALNTLISAFTTSNQINWIRLQHIFAESL